MSTTSNPDAAPDLPPVSQADADELMRQVREQGKEAAPEATAGIDRDTLERLSTSSEPERMTLPPTPLEEALKEEATHSATLDADWLRDYPSIALKNCIPSDDDKARFVIHLIEDTPFVDRQVMLGGKFPVLVRMLTGEVIDALYDYLKPFRDRADKDPFAFADELQHAGCACQVTQILDKRFKPCDTVAEIAERVKEFKAMQNFRWAAILLAVRQANVKGRMLAEMVVNFDADFSSPGASV